MKILLGYDGSVYADAAIEDLKCAGLPNNLEALVLCVADGKKHPHVDVTMESPVLGSWQEGADEAEALARRAADRIRGYFPGWQVLMESSWGSAASAILEAAGWWRPDLIVTGSHGRSGFSRVRLGSVSAALAHEAACAVRVVRGNRPPKDSPPRIVVGVDGSVESAAAIRAVARRSWPDRTEAYIVSVVETLEPTASVVVANTYAHEQAFGLIRGADEHERTRLENAAEDSANALRQAGLSVTWVVVDGDPRQLIPREAERVNADMIFVGARGLGRIERLLLGSVSSHILEHSSCTVEVVR